MKTLSGFPALLFPAMLALLAAACFGDTPDPAVTGPGAPERAPVAADSIPAALVALGTVKTVDAAGYFTDGGELSYTAVSSAPALAAVSVEGSTVTVVGMAKGTATVTVTATGGGGAARQAFAVAVVSLQGPWAWEGEVLAWDSISALKGAGAPEGDSFVEYQEWHEGRAVLNLAHHAGRAGVVVSGGLGVHLILCDPCGGADTGADSGRPEIADSVWITVSISAAASKYIGLAGEQGFGVGPAILAEGQLLHNNLECDSEYVLALTDAGQLRVTGESVCETGYYRYRSGVEVTLSPSRTEVWSGLYPVRGRYRAGGAVGGGYLQISHNPFDHGRLVARLPGCYNASGGVEPVSGGERVRLSGGGQQDRLSALSPRVGGQLAFRSGDRSLTMDPPAFVDCAGEVVDIWTDGAAVVGGPKAAGGPWVAPEGDPSAGGPEGDRAALEALYQATDGPNWERSGNWLTDAPLGDWDGVTADGYGRVKWLDLGGNRLSGPIPPEIGNLGALRLLDLESHLDMSSGGSVNDLSGPIPPEIGNLAVLEWLQLGGNDLSGPIPPEIGNLRALKWLSLDRNRLTGPIPPEIGNLTALEWLYLSFNYDLSGPIPPEIGNLAALEHLELRSNRLSGPIPPEIGNLGALRLLDLHANFHLSGPIPPEIGNLTALKRLDLSVNDLSGPIPPEIGNLAALEYLALWQNSGLCTPDDSRLLAWLAALNVQPPPRCAGGG